MASARSPLGCVTSNGRDAEGAWESQTTVPCSTAHDMEYAGVARFPEGSYPGSDRIMRSLAAPACRTVVAQCLGITENQLEAHSQIWYAWSLVHEDVWAIGDRSARCYLMLADGLPVKRSLKDMEPKRL